MTQKPLLRVIVLNAESSKVVPLSQLVGKASTEEAHLVRSTMWMRILGETTCLVKRLQVIKIHYPPGFDVLAERVTNPDHLYPLDHYDT